jgi:hypothetical protein
MAKGRRERQRAEEGRRQRAEGRGQKKAEGRGRKAEGRRVKLLRKGKPVSLAGDRFGNG